jgi:hypothetical protein
MVSPSHVPNIFEHGTKILADPVNANFQFCLDYVYDLVPTLVEATNYFTYGLNLQFDFDNYRIGFEISGNLLYFSSMSFTRNNVAAAPSTTAVEVFQPNIPKITNLGIFIDYGATNYVERYQDYPLFSPRQSAGGGMQMLTNKSSDLLTAGYGFFPSGNVWMIDNLADAVGSYTFNFECAALTIGETYEFSAIVWAETGSTVRLGVTGGVSEIFAVNTTPVKVSDTFLCTSTTQVLYFKASQSSKGYGIGFYLGLPSNQKAPTYALYDNSFLGTDANNLITGASVDPIDTSGLTVAGGTTTVLSVVTDTATYLLKDQINPGKTTNSVVRLDNSAAIVAGKIVLDQAALTIGVPYSVTVWARVVSGTGGKIRNDNAGPFTDILLGNANNWNRYTVTYTPTAGNQKVFIQPDIGAIVDIAACYITQAASLPQSVLPYHLGATTTYDDELTWTPNLTSSPIIAEWGTDMQTEIDISTGVPVPLGISSKGPWINQPFNTLRSLIPGESIRTYTTPAGATALKQLGTGWRYDYSGEALDHSDYNVLDFEDTFNVMSVGEQRQAPSSTIKWFAPVHTDFGYYKCSFVSPAEADALGVQTWYSDGTNLRIRLQQQASDVYGGCMVSMNLNGEGYRCPQFFYFETRVFFPPYQKFPWSAIWFKNPDVVESTANTYVEFDLAEIYSSDNQFWHSTWHIWPGAHPQVGGPTTHQFKSNLYPMNCVDGSWHVMSMKVTPQWIITYIDGVEARRMPYYAEMRLGNPYILINLTGINDATEYGLFSGQADMFIDYVRVYRST